MPRAQTKQAPIPIKTAEIPADVSAAAEVLNTAMATSSARSGRPGHEGC